MNKKLLIAGLAAMSLAAAACSSPNASTTPANKAAAPPAKPTAAASPAPTTPAPAAAAAGAEVGGKQDFTLVNATGVEINAVHISPHNVNDWEEDILGQDTLPDGQHVDIHFKRGEKAAMWDLRIEDKAGNPIEWENLNLLQISKLTLHYANNKATAEWE